MNNIKLLYLNAKNNRKENDIKLYKESINELLENNPIEYVTNLEYIISSNIGLNTFNEFVNRYGFPIPYYSDILECFENAIYKCKVQEKDDSIYKEYIEKLESFKKQYQHCFAIYEYYFDLNNNEYLSLYYKLFPMFKEYKVEEIDFEKLYSKYGMACIPDILIYNEKFGNIGEALKKIPNDDFKHSQELFEITKDFNVDFSKIIYESSLESFVNSLKERKDNILKESILLENDINETIVEYSNYEIEEIKNLIEFKEYMITALADVNEIIKIQNEVYSLYENFSNIIGDVNEDTTENILPNLPSNINERLSSTSAKRTGSVPDYIKTNHDISTYGEDEPDKEDDKEPNIEDLKRPSADKDSSEDNVDDKLEDLKDDIRDAKTPEEKQQAINNYYYYTYTNSNNKSITSHDDHSMNKRVNSSDTNTHDNSKGKRINSDNINKSNDKNSDEEHTESNNDNLLKEEVGDADNDKPESDHPIRDTLMDIDRAVTKKIQGGKKVVQDVQNVGRVFMKPFKRTSQWINNMVNEWKDRDENSIKEKLADPRARSSLFQAVKTAVLGGSFLKAGLLLNPIFLFLSITKFWGRDKKIFRIRNEMISELKTELQVIDEKIKDADRADDRKAKYQLMRFKNEINKKLIRVGGLKRERKMI